ncbi:hypothetical protein B0T22DRAFT_485182 [Podospora appendiculata]|uniref:Uncharacterized protein n=1 Tax=Podospora appendiculata TaxID=314037 RepID=A0AAE0WZQ9_9PEZI|nr:hypothetical protein B0T22DRAFT_485182 [Podospora appendiculata]
MNPAPNPWIPLSSPPFSPNQCPSPASSEFSLRNIMRFASVIARAVTLLAVGVLAAAVPARRDTSAISPVDSRRLIELHENVDPLRHTYVVEGDDLPPRVRVDKITPRRSRYRLLAAAATAEGSDSE